MNKNAIIPKAKYKPRLSILLFAFLFFFIGSVYAANPINQNENKHFLWAIRTQQNTVYLLGSMHVFKGENYPLSDEIESAYEKSDQLFFETDLEGMKSPAAQAKMMSLGIYTGGETLEKNLSHDTYKALEKKMKEIGLPISQFKRFKPWLSALTIAVFEFEKLGFDADEGIDQYFFNKAKQDGKSVHALESLDFHLNLFTELSKQNQEQFLKQTLKDIELIGKMASEMESAWKSGDAERLDAMIMKSFEGYPGIYARFISQRNQNWIPKIETLLKQKKNTLVVVGAGHLVGNESLVKVLKDRGYSVEQR